MSDHEYFLRRANEELRAAERSANPEARRAHQELANLYLAMIENGSPVPNTPASASECRVSA